MSEDKKRHGCLTALLVLMLIANSAAALMFFLGGKAIKEGLPELSAWTFPVLGVLAVSNLVFAIALLKWKKWGFWGFAVSGFATLVVNIAGGFGIGQSLTGLLGLALLYGVLNIGKDNKGWPQLY